MGLLDLVCLLKRNYVMMMMHLLENNVGTSCGMARDGSGTLPARDGINLPWSCVAWAHIPIAGSNHIALHDHV